MPKRRPHAASSLRPVERMTLLELVVYLMIGGACGAIVRAITGCSPGWFSITALLGFVGAILGTSVAHLLRLQGLLAVDIAGHPLPILWSISGGVFVAFWDIAVHALIFSRTQS